MPEIKYEDVKISAGSEDYGRFTDKYMIGKVIYDNNQ